MVFNVINFVDGYALGTEEGGNLKPLKVNENGIYYPADYNCNAFSQVDVDMPTKATQIDMLPTWGEVIFDDGWSIKIKKSDEIENTDEFNFSMTDSTLPYLHTYQRTWTIYFCVYNGEQLLFGNTQKTYTSQQWSWSMWESDKPWLNVYAGHKHNKITTISAEKTSNYNGLSGLNININFGVEWFSYIYNASGQIETEEHSTSKGSTGRVINLSGEFYTKDDYQKRSEDIIAYGSAVTNSKKFEYKIYDV